MAQQGASPPPSPEAAAGASWVTGLQPGRRAPACAPPGPRVFTAQAAPLPFTSCRFLPPARPGDPRASTPFLSPAGRGWCVRWPVWRLRGRFLGAGSRGRVLSLHSGQGLGSQAPQACDVTPKAWGRWAAPSSPQPAFRATVTQAGLSCPALTCVPVVTVIHAASHPNLSVEESTSSLEPGCFQKTLQVLPTRVREVSWRLKT